MNKEGTTKPSVTRKARRDAPAHIRHKFLTAPLSPTLVGQHGAKKLPVVEDDTVQITRGDRKRAEGKVLRVDATLGKVYIEGVSTTRLDGSTRQMPIRAENVMITKLNLKDEWRKRVLARKGFKKEE